MIFQVVGLLLAITGLIAGFIYFRANRKRKKLAYEVVSNTPLVTVDEAVGTQVQILYNDEPVHDVHLLVLKVLNLGNVAVTPEDFVRPLSFSFGEQSRLLSAEVVETSPTALSIGVETTTGAMTVEKTLLNRGDSATFRVLLTGFDGEVKPDYRIIDVPTVTQIQPREPGSAQKAASWAVATVMAASASAIIPILLHWV